MTIHKKPQNSQDIFVFQAKGSKGGRSHHISMQDKRAVNGARVASGQPSHLTNVMRSQKANNNPHRVKKKSSARLVKLTLWVKPIVKTEIERRAESAGAKKSLSLSSTGAAILERGLQADLDMQYGAMLEPAIRNIMHDENQAIRSELRWLLTKITFETGQTRSMVTNILNRQPGMTNEIFRTIVRESADAARNNISRRTPQMQELLDLIDSWRGAGEEERKKPD